MGKRHKRGRDHLQAAKARKSTLRDITVENVSLLKTWKVEGEVAGNADGAAFENLNALCAKAPPGSLACDSVSKP